MFSTSLLTVLGFLPIALVSAGGWQDTVHEVIVGGPGILRYHPEHVIAHPGDIVRFQFLQKNHTATQSTLEAPCTALHGGFDTGFKPVPDDQLDHFPTYDYKVSSKDPVWFYCRQGNHCSQGMVFAINPHRNFHHFLRAAKATAAAPPTGAKAPGIDDGAPGKSGWPQPTHYSVTVGGAAGNVYTPNVVHAKKGDTITFEFRQKNHTLTQSTFDQPCSKFHGGFDTGFKPVPPEQNSHFPTWKFIVQDDTKPIWAYCQQTGHCKGGMVFAVNPGDKFQAFQQKAKAS